MIQETNNERNRANRMLASLAGKVENKLNFKPICSSNSMNDCVHGSFFIFWRFFRVNLFIYHVWLTFDIGSTIQVDIARGCSAKSIKHCGRNKIFGIQH